MEENIDKLTINPQITLLIDAMTKVLGKVMKEKRSCVINVILDLCDKRRSLKNGLKDHPVAVQNYGEVNKEIMRKRKEANVNWITDRCKEIDSGIRTGNSNAASTL